jgi:hypothetical protein
MICQIARRALLAVMLTMVVVAEAQSRTIIAVADLTSGTIDQAALDLLTRRLSGKLHETDQFTIIERDKMDRILAEQGFQQGGCVAEECIVEMGQLLGASAIIVGSLGKLGTLHMFEARLIDVETGEVVATTSRECRCDLEEVAIRLVEEVAADLAAADARRVGGLQSDTSSASGVLRVDSTPEGGRVYIDGQLRRDETPAIIENVSAGDHTVRVEKDHLVGEEPVTVQSNGITRLRVPLRPGRGILRVNSKPPNAEVYLRGSKVGETPFLESATAGPAELELRMDGYHSQTRQIKIPRDGREEVAVTLSALHGTLRVVSHPARAKVFLRGQRVGETPILINDINSGAAELELRLAGHHSHRRQVVIPSGGQEEIAVTMVAMHSRLRVVSRPARADVYLRGRKVGTTPLLLDAVTAGSAELELHLNGYKDYAQQLTLRANKQSDVTVTLRKKPIYEPPRGTVFGLDGGIGFTQQRKLNSLPLENIRSYNGTNYVAGNMENMVVDFGLSARWLHWPTETTADLVVSMIPRQGYKNDPGYKPEPGTDWEAFTNIGFDIGVGVILLWTNQSVTSLVLGGRVMVTSLNIRSDWIEIDDDFVTYAFNPRVEIMRNFGAGENKATSFAGTGYEANSQRTMGGVRLQLGYLFATSGTATVRRLSNINVPKYDPISPNMDGPYVRISLIGGEF